MKIQFIGAGSAFTTAEYYQSNMLITAANGQRLLLDCGSDVRLGLAECGLDTEHIGRELHAVYISHLHADHVGGMEWLARATRYARPPARLALYAQAKLLHAMWNETLAAGLDCMPGKHMHLTDYFACHPLQADELFQWATLRCRMVRMPHIINTYKHHYSYGLLLQEDSGNSPRVFITTDTVFVPDILEAFAPKIDVIFHDCETAPFKTGVHTHYEELLTLPKEIRRKMWLYHYQPNPPFTPEQDGFLGFVAKGQSFVLD